MMLRRRREAAAPGLLSLPVLVPVLELALGLGLVLGVGVGLPACGGSSHTSKHYLDGHAALTDAGLIHVVVEIPAGTNAKWEVDKTSGALRWEERDGVPRVVQYLAYPANYGMVPRTRLPRELGGDGDPLDVVLLGPRVERGAVVAARPIGVLRLLDDGERDDKVLAVQATGPLSDVTDLETLDARYAGAREILATWFTHYKGPGRITSSGFGDAAAALSAVREASRAYDQRVEPPGRP
ncbi:MAG: inorganic diphosphatase [Proteobacteria bacterium]|nr:inorganic diphosphatase [Pseudomonadota bacterium]